MYPYVQAFRNALAQLCQKKGVKLRKILDDFDVDEALEEANDANFGVRELAALVLWKCCCTNGCWNNSSIVFLAIMTFLAEEINDIGQQPFIDLGKLLKGGTTEEAIRKWIETHYP